MPHNKLPQAHKMANNHSKVMSVAEFESAEKKLKQNSSYQMK